jgi:hypothetical protein
MFDNLDRLIQRYRMAFHEANRVAGANRRLAKERKSQAAARFDQVFDRVKLNCPLPERAKCLHLSDKQFQAECAAVLRFQMQMTITILNHQDGDGDPNDRPDLTF